MVLYRFSGFNVFFSLHSTVAGSEQPGLCLHVSVVFLVYPLVLGYDRHTVRTLRAVSVGVWSPVCL